MKKFISLLLAVLMTVGTMVIPSFAATTDFVDVDTDNEVLVEAVDLLDYMGVAKGMSDTKFGTDELVTREQFALFVYRLMKGGKDAPANASNTTPFTDLENPTYFYAINWANAAGIVNGKSATTFCPKDPIKLQEAYAMLTRALEWENEDTVYPYGHIEIAEQTGVTLDRGLDATIGYIDELTRADMAIILYNTFFAEMGIENTKTTWIELSNGINYPLKETIHPALCEEKFDVKELELQAIATPHYTTEDAEATYDLGYDAIYLKDINGSIEGYVSAKDLGLEDRNLDDYFYGIFTVYAEIEDNEIDKILFADCNMVKASTNHITLGTVSGNKTNSYFEGTEAKLLSGKLTFDDTDVYVYNAPYSYAKGNYTSKDADEQYEIRNKENLKTISFIKETDDENYYYVAHEDFITDENFVADPEKLLNTFAQVYYGGLYDATFYDINADGIYDYVNYVPYTLFQVDSDEEEYFEDSDFDLEVPYIYTNEATVSGVRFSDEDYVIGYFDENNETVYVAEVIKPIVTTIKNIKEKTGKIILSSGASVDAVSAWKYITNYDPKSDTIVIDDEDEIAFQVAENALFDWSIVDKKDKVELYIYNDVVLYHTTANNISKYSGNLVIPTDYKEPHEDFDAELGDTFTYIHVYINGITRYIPVKIDDVYPALIENGEVTSAYKEQLCTYTIEDGLYVLTSLAEGVDENDENIGLTTEITDLDENNSSDYIGYNQTDVTMTKKAGSRFTLSCEDRQVVLQNYTEIIVRQPSSKNGEYEYLVFNKEDFTSSVESIFTTATYILTNDTDSKTKENLSILYATVDDEFDFVPKSTRNSYRIVCSSEREEYEENDWRNLYTVINPYSGKIENVWSKESALLAKDVIEPIESGKKVKLANGYINETKGAEDLSDATWVIEYDTNDNVLVLADITDTACKDCIEATEDIVIEIDDKTTVTVLKADSKNELFTDGVLSVVNKNVLENQKNTYLCYNEIEKNGDLKDKYAPFIKAYVSYTIDEDDDIPVADYIIITVYGEDDLITNEVCNNH